MLYGQQNMERIMPKFIEVRNDVFATGSVACDFKETREFYRANIDDMIKAFDECKKIFKVDNVKLFVRNLRKAQGHYSNAKREIAVDVRVYDLKSIVSTIIHEMTHAQQYATKKMSQKGEKVIFEKVEYNRVKPSKNFEDYQNQPWEIEAREMEAKYIDRVMKAISK
jgi:hypothetical protein